MHFEPFNSGKPSTKMSTPLYIIWIVALTEFCGFSTDYLPPIERPVLSSQGSEILLSWEAPYTKRNLTYCVDVKRSTSQRVEHSQCELTTTTFTYSMPPKSSCEIYVFAIYPMNENDKGPVTRTSFRGAETSKRLACSRTGLSSMYNDSFFQVL